MILPLCASASLITDPALFEIIRVYKITEYELTGFKLSIVGTAEAPEPFNFTTTRGRSRTSANDRFLGGASEGRVGLGRVGPSLDVHLQPQE
jgi:hypothetical protein